MPTVLGLELTLASIVARCFRAQLGLFSPNLIDQSSCRMGLVLACVVRILHDDWSIRLGENRPDEARKYLVAMLRWHEVIGHYVCAVQLEF